MSAEIFPKIEIEAGLGVDIVIDRLALVSFMRAQGFSDEQIIDTTVHVRSETSRTHVYDESGHEMIPVGAFDSDTRTISLFPVPLLEEKIPNINEELSATLIHELHHLTQEVRGGGESLNLEDCKVLGRTALLLTASFSTLSMAIYNGFATAARLANYEMNGHVDTAAALSSATVALIGALAVTRPWERTYAEYRSSAAEQQSYEAENEVPEGLVTVIPRQTNRSF